MMKAQIQTLTKMKRMNQEGLAYIEFAMIAPFLIALLMGTIEMTRFILITQKVEKTSVTIADVVSQASTIKTTELNNIITAANQVMSPYSFGPKGYVIISSVTQTGNYTLSNPPLVNWQYKSAGATGSWIKPSKIGVVGTAATLPGGLTLDDKDNIIIAEVFYNYSPIVTSGTELGNVTLYKLGLYKPRLGSLSILSAYPFWTPINGAVL
jgi:hypothetical protein